MAILKEALEKCPGIAILRGVQPEQVLDVAAVLYDAGFRIVEVPLNSPDPLESINRLANAYGDQVIVGAGTVLTPREVEQVARAGGKIVLSPNFRSGVVQRSIELGLISVPGVATPSEAFSAIEEGADMLKLFPCEMITPAVVKSLRAVLPKETLLAVVGGIGIENLGPFLKAGANVAGFGSSLYRPGLKIETLFENAERLAAALPHTKKKVKSLK